MVNKAKTKIQVKNDANRETLQPTKQNNMAANNNNYKVSKMNKQPTKTKIKKYTRRLRYIMNT